MVDRQDERIEIRADDPRGIEAVPQRQGQDEEGAGQPEDLSECLDLGGVDLFAMTPEAKENS